MKRHEGFFDELMLEDSDIGEPKKSGSTIEIPVIRNLRILVDHPLGQGRNFYVDGFTLRFEGVTKSVRQLTAYDSDGDLTGDETTIDDGPFPAVKGETQAFHDMVSRTDYEPKSFVVWHIDAERFSLIEPEEPWQRFRSPTEPRE